MKSIEKRSAYANVSQKMFLFNNSHREINSDVSIFFSQDLPLNHSNMSTYLSIMISDGFIYGLNIRFKYVCARLGLTDHFISYL